MEAASPDRAGASAIPDRTGTNAARGPIRNAMTVDVEDYFQVWAFSSQVAPGNWDCWPTRVERNTDLVLETFAEAGTRATFFTLGWVAERFPTLVRRIVDAGHELASHGMAHVRVSEQTPEQFAADAGRAKVLLEDTGGCPVRGFRAASFSISASTPWAFDVLADAGYLYSSSIHPIRHDHYSMPHAPRFAHRPAGSSGGVIEVPVTTLSLGQRRIPCGGGGYFRLLPYAFSRWALSRVLATGRQPCVFYFHPWEFDPEQPRIPGASTRARFRHYTNLGRMRGKVRRVLGDFAWDRMDVAIGLDEPGEQVHPSATAQARKP